MKRILILYLVSVWFCIADAEIRFNPLNVERVEGVVGVTHDELRDAISSGNPSFSNAVNEVVATKAEKPVHSAEDNLAALTADGNLKDIGKKASDFAPAVEGGYLPLSGGTMKGDVTFEANGITLGSGGWIFGGGIATAGAEYQKHNLYHHWYYNSDDSSTKDPKFEIAVKGDISALESSKADKTELNSHIANTNNPHAVTAEQAGAVPLVEDTAGAKTAVTIGIRTGDVGSNSLANGGSVVASGDYSHAEGFRATASGDNSHAEGYRTTASADGSHAEGNYAYTKEQDHFAFAWNGDETRMTPYESHGVGTFNVNPAGGLNGFWIGEQTLYTILTNKADKSSISATDQTFSDAVLAVNVDFATNTTGAAYVAVTNALAGFGFDADALAELPGGKVYGSIGALLAALAAAVTWLKKKALIGGLTGGVPDDPKVHDFFTNSNGLLTATIAANSARLALDEDGEIIVTMNTED